MGIYSKSFRFEGGGRSAIGLKRTGKSCRLRWVNYLHPGLKRGKMAPHEEKLVLELHSQWGNKWSRIARKLPGRTDNEIKNYWRTRMRKEAQEKKRSKSPSSPSTNFSTSSSSNNEANSDYKAATETDAMFSLQDKLSEQEVYSMDDIWKDITTSDETIKPMYRQGSNFSSPPIASPLWDYCPDTPWQMDLVDEESTMFFQFNDPFLPC